MEEECLSDDEDEEPTIRPNLGDASRTATQNRSQAGSGSSAVGPTKTKIVVRDAAFRTWYALIYYLYTDVIVFAPLSSSFIEKSDPVDTAAPARSSRQADRSENQILKGIKGRKEWLDTWMTEMDARAEGTPEPVPCSAKAIYRLADVSKSLMVLLFSQTDITIFPQKLDLPRLRQRAFQHIISQLTVQNCPFEVFTNFSATYEQVRKVSRTPY
jgi:hypothetical protein